MISTMSIRRLTLFSLLAILLSTAWAADLRVQVDRTRLSLDDVLGVELIAEGETQGQPDFTSVSKDFDILSQGQSQVTSIVNGKISHTQQWSLQLAPKHKGRLEIPPIAIGSDRSAPVTVDVVDSGQSTADVGAKPLFLEAEADTKRPYVQQVIDYRVKVYFRQEPQRAVLSEPQADGATVQQVGDDRGYDEYVDGQLYHVVERRYQIIPQRSGQLRIQSPRLEAMLPDPNRVRRDPFADLDEAFGGQFFQGFPQIPGITHPGRRVVERAQDLDIDVRPQPAGSGAQWLPATSVQVSDEWTPSPPVFRVGDPVTRTLTITAQGTTTAQLPNLDLGKIEGAQVYPDQPHAEDLTKGSAPAAVKTFKTALVPTRTGSLTLPEIRLPWWDTVADKPRVVVVPARTVQVLPAPGGTQQPAPPAPAPAQPEQTAQASAKAPASAAPAAQSRPSAAPAETPAPAPAGSSSWIAGAWPWITLVIGLGWIATLVWWYLDRRRSARSTARAAEVARGPREVDGAALKAASRAVQTACASNDPRAARAALIAWAQVRWPEDSPPGLEGIAVRLEADEAAPLLRSVDRAIYAPPGVSWEGAAAWAALEPILKASTRGRAQEEEDDMPELYPQL